MADAQEQAELPGVNPPQRINIVPNEGKLVSPIHTVRQMKVFGVTENELRTITVMNAATAAFFSLGTGCFGYLLSLKENAAFSDKIPAATQAAMTLIQPGLIVLGLTFYICGFVTWIIRGGFIKTIKQESDPELLAQAKKGRFSRAWDEFWR